MAGLGYPGSQYAMDGTLRSINYTVPSNVYPTSIRFSGGYWKNLNTQQPKTLTIYLSNSNKSVVYTLGSITMQPDDSVTANQIFSVSCPNLAGAALYIYGNDVNAELRNQVTITIGTTPVAAHPTVSAGDPITKVQMDLLRSYLNRGTVVTQGYSIAASVGNTYKSGLTAGTTPIDDAWYNNA